MCSQIARDTATVTAGGTWVFRVMRLCMYTCLLMPGFAQASSCCLHRLQWYVCCIKVLITNVLLLQMFFFYFLSSRVIRSVAFGKKPRQRLDIFVPKHHWKENDSLRPVVIYVTGATLALIMTMLPVSSMSTAMYSIACMSPFIAT